MITHRNRFIPEGTVAQEAEEALDGAEVDHIEFRGTGEPFLAKNLIEMVKALRRLSNVPIAVITNASLFQLDDVQEELNEFDIVVVKLDAADEDGFQSMNRPHSSIHFDNHLNGIIKVRRRFPGSLRIQVTLVQENLEDAERIAELCDDIEPEMVYLNTPQCLGANSISRNDLMRVAPLFKHYQVRTIFDDG